MRVIKITASWCPSCIIMNSVFNKIKEEYSLEVISYDYDFDNKDIVNYDVGKILPVFIFLDDNDKEITRLIGEVKKEEFLKIIAK